MSTLEKFLSLLFGAIVVGLIVSNPTGISKFFAGVTGFTKGTVGAFTGFKEGAIGGTSVLPYGF